ncbi:hypothetical protein SCLCIDRAFT_1210972, partial [Scleroderma citrinum Foug A]
MKVKIYEAQRWVPRNVSAPITSDETWAKRAGTVSTLIDGACKHKARRKIRGRRREMSVMI